MKDETNDAGPEETVPAHYPGWLKAAERRALDTRRSALGEPDLVDAEQVGLALSGGGIRSATFSLGVVQALARAGVLPRIDYLSTVSGGGYIGAFLGALYARGASTSDVLTKLTEFPESRELHWLRSNGRFLAPNGAGANWLAGAVLLRNWLSLLFVVAPVALLLSFLCIYARATVDAQLQQRSLAWIATFLTEHQLSPLLAVSALFALFWLLPCWLAYWMVNAGHIQSRGRLPSAIAVILILLAPPIATLYWCPAPLSLIASSAFSIITACAFFNAARLRSRMQRHSGRPASASPFGPDHDNIARNKLSEWLKSGFMAVVMATGVALLDSLAFAAFNLVRGGVQSAIENLIAVLSAAATLVATLVAGTHRILALLGGMNKKKGNGSVVPVQLLIALAATVLLIVGDIVVSTTAYWLAVPDGQALPSAKSAGIGAGASFFAMLLLGSFRVFVNQSSLGPIYNARLTRAYVGASNPHRWKEEDGLTGRGSPTEPIPGDQLSWDEYKPYRTGGPLHLINVTVNETIDPRVQLHQPDRKGMVMAIGPVGVSLAVRHHAAWDGSSPKPDESTFQVFPTGKELKTAERLALGHWVAISGAAVATGLGQLSSWGTSLLCGVFNMRLGYWWLSNIDAASRPRQAKAVSIGGYVMSALGWLLPVYRLLAAEFLDRFPGTAIPSWYLTDGGHLENTGCYELIRRRLPFIIAVDNGADPAGACSDLANLVRLARVDFGAEIEFLTHEQLQAVLDPSVAPYFGSVQALEREPPSPPVYAGLARVRYKAGGADSWLILIKPRVLGTEPMDITAYGLAHGTFPQQSTGDQSFDDAQWEAYRKLGDWIGSRLFGAEGQLEPGRWWPSWLDARARELLKVSALPRRPEAKEAPPPSA